jgi:hypothetical protein
MGQIFFAGEEAQERPALLRDLIANSAAQHGIAGFQRVQHRALRHWSFDFNLHLNVDVRQSSQMLRQCDSDHVNVCTSTESTAGKSRTIGAQLSPASAEA